MTFLSMAVGLAILTVGAEVLVRGASALALTMRISPLVVGLTVVAFGTSAPELVVSLQSAVAGQGDIALGNVVGSNIFNVLFILGASALITPLVVSQQLVRFDVPLMIGISVLLAFQGADGRIGRIDGLILCLMLFSYTVWAVRSSRREQSAVQQEYAEGFGTRPPATAWRTAWQVILVVVGLALLMLGARLFLDSAVEIARDLGVSELVIGLTLVAAGTSLPEVATSILAAIRGERDIAVGNVVGSNLFNIMGVLGASGLVAAKGVPVSEAALMFDIPVMIGVAIACLPVFFTGHLIARWEGGMFLAYYAVYTAFLVLSATGSTWTESLTQAMLWFVLPLTAVTLAVGVARAARRRPDGKAEPPKGDD